MMKKLLLALLLGLGACGGNLGPEVDTAPDDEAAIVSMPDDAPATAFDVARLTSQTEECYTIWECPRCGVRQRQNVEYQYCPDGSRTVVASYPCGALDCF